MRVGFKGWPLPSFNLSSTAADGETKSQAPIQLGTGFFGIEPSRALHSYMVAWARFGYQDA